MEVIRCRLDGRLEGVRGPIPESLVDRASIAGTMGWTDSGEAAGVITSTLGLLAQGKSVRLTSHYGFCEFLPLAPNETGHDVPASWKTMYRPDGSIVHQ